MDFMENMLTRRSVRNYAQQPVEQEKVEQLLRAAMQAPSAGNGQPWHFVVLTDRNFLIEVPKFHPYSKMLPSAALAILVCGDEKVEKYAHRWPLDCGAATQNILLAAHGLGLGAVWLGIHPNNDRAQGFRNLLKLPDHIHPFALVSIGYPAERPPAEDRYKPERIHYNQW
jgi:nitroreductase